MPHLFIVFHLSCASGCLPRFLCSFKSRIVCDLWVILFSLISLRLFARALVLTLLTYLRPSTRWEHGPSIKALHRILPCAIVAIFCQVYPIFLASDSTSRRQVFLGSPLPLGIPCQGLSCDARCRFSQRVTDPTPFSSLYFYFYWSSCRRRYSRPSLCLCSFCYARRYETKKWPSDVD